VSRAGTTCRGFRCEDGSAVAVARGALLSLPRRAASTPSHPLRGALASLTLRKPGRRNSLAGARQSGQQTVGYGVHRVFRVGSPCLAAEEVSLAPSPPPTSPERVAGREMGGRTRAKSWNIGFPTVLRTLTSPLSRLGSSSRTFARVAREWVNTRLRDPPDLRCRLARHLPSPSVQPVTRLDCLSWIVQRSPLRRPGDTGVHSRREPLRDPPSGRACHGSSMFRPRGFSPPRRFTPPMPGACLATRSRPWGSPRFGPPAARLP